MATRAIWKERRGPGIAKPLHGRNPAKIDGRSEPRIMAAA
jgi:hypothetical protein